MACRNVPTCLELALGSSCIQSKGVSVTLLALTGISEFSGILVEDA